MPYDLGVARPRRRRRRLRRLFTFAAVAGAVFAWRERNMRENDPSYRND